MEENQHTEKTEMCRDEMGGVSVTDLPLLWLAPGGALNVVIKEIRWMLVLILSFLMK